MLLLKSIAYSGVAFNYTNWLKMRLVDAIDYVIVFWVTSQIVGAIFLMPALFQMS